MKSKRKASSIATAFVLMTVVAQVARADLVTPTAAYGSTQNTSARGAVNAINNSNLSSPFDLTATHTWVEDNGAWQTNNNTIDGNWIAFNLGGAYDLTQANVWNYRQSGFDGRAMKNIDVYVSSLASPALPSYATVSGTTVTQGATQTDAQVLALGGGGNWTKAIDNHTLLRVSASSPEAVQSFALTQNNIQWVMIRVDGGQGTGNYGDGSFATRTGLFEVKFTGTVIPEPATLSMVGMIGIAMLLRRMIHG